MNVLIVGGAGFIGSQLADALLADGCQVTVIDNLLRGRKENLSGAFKNKFFNFIEGDASDYFLVSSILRKFSIDYVFHLAANSDIQASVNDPSIEFHHTLSTTWAVLMAMRECKVKNLFFSSTSAVYGELGGQQEFSEEKSLHRPVSYYGGAKSASEAFIHSFSYMNDMNSLIFRFPNVIGKRLTHGVIFDFISRLRKNPNELRVLGDGSQSKPYMHCDDLISAIMLLYRTNRGLNIYQVGAEGTTSVKTIAEAVVDEMGLRNSCKIIYGTSQVGWKGDVSHFSYNLEKIHKTGWKATMTSYEAVLLTIRQSLGKAT